MKQVKAQLRQEPDRGELIAFFPEEKVANGVIMAYTEKTMFKCSTSHRDYLNSFGRVESDHLGKNCFMREVALQFPECDIEWEF